MERKGKEDEGEGVPPESPPPPSHKILKPPLVIESHAYCISVCNLYSIIKKKWTGFDCEELQQ